MKIEVACWIEMHTTHICLFCIRSPIVRIGLEIYVSMYFKINSPTTLESRKSSAEQKY
jgi:hypothetical protein